MIYLKNIAANNRLGGKNGAKKRKFFQKNRLFRLK